MEKRIIRQKICSDLPSLYEAVQNHKLSGRSIVFTNGCFDLLHAGHVEYLERAAQLGDVLIVAINSDASVRELKGPHRPIQQEEDRTKIIASLESVDHVALFYEPTPLKLIEQILPDFLVKGGDWSTEQIVGNEVVISNGGSVISLPFTPGRSTTNIEEVILSKRS